jgi:hypothetical protein
MSKENILLSKCRVLLLTIFFSLFTINQVFATSWVELSAEKVDQRSDVIVFGTYDLSGELISGKEMIFQGTQFQVQHVYKGEAANRITVGIDPFDIGWVEEFQNDGGEFLLFLEEGEEFLLPVGGPNGMIEVQNDQVINNDESKRLYYQDILNRTPEKPSVLSSSSEESNKEEILNHPAINLLLYAGIIIIVGTILASSFKRYQKNKA